MKDRPIPFRMCKPEPRLPPGPAGIPLEIQVRTYGYRVAMVISEEGGDDDSVSLLDPDQAELAGLKLIAEAREIRRLLAGTVREAR